MKHLGDITKISGYDAPVVDVIIGGSPCQDLSIAGKRAGLAGARSGLYMEQIRIIKEMREADVLRGRTGELIRPRFMVWENVPGAFSSNKGQDFAAVLEEAIRVAEPQAPPVSVPDKGWPTSGCFFDVDGRWSVAWRVLDAQFWGVPQRRRRIALVADFGGLAAPEILFIRKSVSGHSEPGEPERKETAGAAGEGADGAGKVVGFPLGFRPENVRCYDDVATTLCNGTRPGFTNGIITEQPLCIEMTSTNNTVADTGISPTLTARMGTGGNQVNAVLDKTYQKVTGPLMANSHPGSYTGQDAFNDMLIAGVDCRNATECPGKNGTLQAKSGGGSSLNYNQMVRVHHIVRRLTPLECERLQGYPDGWTNLPPISDMTDEEYDFWKTVQFERAVRELRARKNEDGVFEIWKLTETEDENGGTVEVWENTHKPCKHKTKAQMVTWYNKMVSADSARYKALGNSIALPPWKWILKRLCACYERDATMASLFDGIGGFPYIWEQLNGEGSCLWASEIEEFPMAVTKFRFGG